MHVSQAQANEIFSQFFGGQVPSQPWPLAACLLPRLAALHSPPTALHSPPSALPMQDPFSVLFGDMANGNMGGMGGMGGVGGGGRPAGMQFQFHSSAELQANPTPTPTLTPTQP